MYLLLIQSILVLCMHINTFAYRNEAQSKSGKNKQTQGYLKKKIADTGRKIKQTQKDISKYMKDTNTLVD